MSVGLGRLVGCLGLRSRLEDQGLGCGLQQRYIRICM